MKVKDELIKEREIAKTTHFWGTVIGIFSVMQGSFLLYHVDYLSLALNTYLLGVDEDWLGLLLLVFGVVKLLGNLVENNSLRAVGIIGLSATWAMLWVVSLLWSFGIGYPSNTFLSTGFMLIACLRVAYKGGLND